MYTFMLGLAQPGGPPFDLTGILHHYRFYILSALSRRCVCDSRYCATRVFVLADSASLLLAPLQCVPFIIQGEADLQTSWFFWAVEASVAVTGH